MKVRLHTERIRFRKDDIDASPAGQRDIIARRIAGSGRMIQEGDWPEILEDRGATLRGGAWHSHSAAAPSAGAVPHQERGAARPWLPSAKSAWARSKKEEAGYNTFLLKEDKGSVILIDLLTDSGTSAISDLQWSAMLRGNEDYAGSRSYYRLEKAVQEVYGWQEVVPTPGERGGEASVSTIYIKPLLEQYPGIRSMSRRTCTSPRPESTSCGRGGVFLDVIIDEARA